MTKKRDIILIVEGGCMRGIFSCGVLNAIENSSLYNRIHSIYAWSAGAHASAYFLAKETAIGETIFGDLVDHHAVRPNLFFSFLMDLFLRIFFKKKHIKTMIDINYLKNLEKGKVKLNLKLLKKSKIKFYVRVFNLRKLKNVYLDGKEDTIKTIEASSALIPFYPHTVLTNGIKGADGGMIPSETIPDKKTMNLIKDNPDKKIIYVFNKDIVFPNMLLNILGNFFHAIALGIFKNPLIFVKKTMSLLRFPMTYKAISYEHVYPVVNKNGYFSFCTNKKDLFDLYKYGQKEGSKVVTKIKGLK
jgi:hypothetical protein